MANNDNAVFNAAVGKTYNESAGYKPRRLLPFVSEKITATRAHFKYVQAHVLPLVENLSREYQNNLLIRFSKTFNELGYYEAHKDLSAIVAPVTAVLNLCPFDDLTLLHDEVKRQDVAHMLAIHVKNRITEFGNSQFTHEHEYDENVKKCYQFICDIVKTYQIKFPYNPYPERKEGLFVSEAESGLLRFWSGDYWESQFNTIAKRTNEHVAIALNQVRKNFSPYVSSRALSNYKIQCEDNQNYLNMMDVVNEQTGDKQSLAELVKLGSADPEKRRIELMVRCRGLEELALKQGREAVFLTGTSPSKYHKNSPHWNLSSPKQTSNYLVKLWSQIRAELARENINYNGVRVSEPHCDATPHWHILLFVKPEQRNKLIQICQDYFCAEDKQELLESWVKYQKAVKNKKARSFRKDWFSPRFTAEIIDPKKGSATGYIAKYISKNINGAKMQGMVDDEAEIQVDESAQRVTAWASLWGIRQFQFFGAESVTVWRECRRAKEPFKCPKMEMTRQAADKGDWQEFTESMQKHKLQVVYEDSGEVNTYNEPLLRIKGVESVDSAVVTRLFSFALEKKVLSFSPWSPVINCTNNEKVTENNWTISQREKSKLEKLGFDDGSIEFLLSGEAVYLKNQRFEIIDNQLRC